MTLQLTVDADSMSYGIQIEKGLLGSLSEIMWRLCRTTRIFIITDSIVDDLYGDMVLYGLLKNGFTPRRYVVPAGEKSKSLTSAEKIYEAMIAFGMTRQDVLIALGGGVVGDLAGFVAATYQRGIPIVQIPTTLLAQVDSSVGGKVAVNLPQGKNMVGVFYQPKAVLIDPLVLNSLSDKNFSDGMAEVVKYGCIKDETFLTLLEGLAGRELVMERIEEIIYRCCDIKREIVEKDEYDTGERMLLNFGHTLGHAVESLSGYGYTHGEGVAAGMHAITELSEAAGITEPETSDRIRNLLGTYGLPYQLPSFGREEIMEAVLRDKKKLGDELHLVLLERLGKAHVHRTDVGFFNELKVCNMQSKGG